jgi:hypothetical protein
MATTGLELIIEKAMAPIARVMAFVKIRAS